MSTAFSYNEADQPLTESYAGGALDGLSVERHYDPALRLTQLQIRDAAGPLESTDYLFSPTTGRLSGVGNRAQTVDYSYLANSDQIQQLSFPSGRLSATRQYDGLERLTLVSWKASGRALPLSNAYRYNLIDQRTRVTQADGRYWQWDYDPLGQLTRGTHFWYDGLLIAGQDFQYSFDHIGNRTATGGRASAISSYSPNRLNQLESRTVAGVLDVLGVANPGAEVKVNGTTATRTGEYFHHPLSLSNDATALYQELSVSSSYGAGQRVSGKLFVARNPEIRLYDLDGNLLQDGRWEYRWDAENRLIQIQSLAGAPAGSQRRLEFDYDHRGRRIAKRVYAARSGGALLLDLKFLYDGWNLLGELDGAGQSVRTYVWGMDLSGRVGGAGGVGGLLKIIDHQASRSYYVPADGNGNVMALVESSSGTLEARYEYGPFGERLRATGSAIARDNPFGFSTHYTDAQTGLVYYGMRYYNPSTGRWLSRDPLGEPGGLDLYGVLHNDPINRVDPFGLEDGDIPRAGALIDPYFWDPEAQRYVTGAELTRKVGSTVLRQTGELLAGGALAKFLEQTLRICKILRGSKAARNIGRTRYFRSAAKAPLALPGPKVNAKWRVNRYRHGGEMSAIEHINYRHAFDSGFEGVTRFSKGTSVKNIKSYVDDALRNGNVTPQGSNAFKIEYDLGRTIGTNPAGDAASHIRIFVRDGNIQTAFPFTP